MWVMQRFAAAGSVPRSAAQAGCVGSFVCLDWMNGLTAHKVKDVQEKADMQDE